MTQMLIEYQQEALKMSWTSKEVLMLPQFKRGVDWLKSKVIVLQ